MNFQHLQKVESAQFYIDVAFNKAKKKVDLGRSSVIARDNLSKSRQIEIERVNIAGNSLKDNLGKIIKHFPVIDDMDDFYKELIKSTLDYVALKKSLGAMKWASSKIDFMVRTYKQKIQRCVELRMINSIRREFYGRVCSVIKQVKDNLTYIEECRRIMRGYPSIKTAVYTVCIFGFPNVGKSTLLKKLTGANPEIKDYAFTTKSLNLGYITTPVKKIQIIDTPGTLNRIEKMNNIEFQAYLAVKHLANEVIFVFDPTDDMKKQEELLRKLKEFGKKATIYLSKTDKADPEDIEKYKKKYDVKSFEDLKF